MLTIWTVIYTFFSRLIEGILIHRGGHGGDTVEHALGGFGVGAGQQHGGVSQRSRPRLIVVKVGQIDDICRALQGVRDVRAALGVLREGESMASRILKNMNIDLDKVRQEVIKALDPNYLPGFEGGAAPGQ